MNNFTKYSNSWGHLLMSIVFILTGLVLILATGDATMKGVGVTLIMTSSGYWFVSSVAAHGNGPYPPQGVQGPQGDQGVQGPQGRRGIQGPQS